LPRNAPIKNQEIYYSIAKSNLELVFESIFGTSLASLSGDVQVDKEKDWKECSKKNGQVSTKLNLKRQRSGRKSLNDRVHGESRGGKSSDGGSGSGSLECCLSNC
jgi:hypothetical protein